MADKYTYFNENPDIIDPSFSQAKALPSFVSLHNSGTGNYIPGICTENLDQFSPRTSQYQEQIVNSSGCSFFEEFTKSGIATQNYTNDGICSPYWIRKIDSGGETENDNSTVTSRQMHWLNGGYFYGMEKYRKYIYNELGTIHFSTNVKYDIESSDVNDLKYNINYIPEFYVNSPRQEFKILAVDFDVLPITYYHAPSMFDIGSAFLSINNFYNLEQRTVESLLPVIKYNPTTKKYESSFEENTMFINNCGYNTCSTEKPVQITEPDNIAVMLSNGNISYYPLTNEKVPTQFHHRKSFSIGESAGLEKLFFDFITPTTDVYDRLNNYIGSVDNQTFNSYFINNSFKTPYNFTTTSVSLSKSPNEFYNNFKFICNTTTSGIIKISKDQQILHADQYNDIVSTEDYTLLLDIFNYMKTTYSNINLIVTFYYITSDGIKITLDTNNNILQNNISILTNIKLGENSFELSFDENTQEALAEWAIDNIGNLGNRKICMMIKASICLTGYSNNTSNYDALGGKVYSGIIKNTITDSFEFQSPELPDSLNQSKLFDTNSSRFSTPDYSTLEVNSTSFSLPVKVPFRGSEYVENNIKDHPLIRYIRKPNGKFYIQILAGAFPYYHAVVHNPVTQHLTPGTQETPTEYSLRQICSKNPEWYKHVATTKWTCYIKHTEFGSDSSDYTSLNTEKSYLVPQRSSVVGGRPPGAKPKKSGSTAGDPFIIGPDSNLVNGSSYLVNLEKLSNRTSSQQREER